MTTNRNERELNKEDEINALFSYALSKANDLGLNMLISVNGTNKMILAGDPDKMYTKMFNKLNKKAIAEFEAKRKSSMTFYDLFAKVMGIYENNPDVLDVIYKETHYTRCKRFKIKDRNIVFQFIPYVKLNTGYDYIGIGLDGEYNDVINFSEEKHLEETHNFLTIIADDFIYSTFDFYVTTESFFIGRCDRDTYEIKLPALSEYKRIDLDEKLTFGEFFKDDAIDELLDMNSLAILMDYVISDKTGGQLI